MKTVLSILAIMAVVGTGLGTLLLTEPSRADARNSAEDARNSAEEVGRVATSTFKVENMTCASCPISVKTAMSRVDGVIDVDIDYKTKMATARFDPSKTTIDTIAKASSAVGFPATVVSAPVDH